MHPTHPQTLAMERSSFAACPHLVGSQAAQGLVCSPVLHPAVYSGPRPTRTPSGHCESSMARMDSAIVRCHLSTRPFCCGLYGAAGWRVTPSLSAQVATSPWNSIPPSERSTFSCLPQALRAFTRHSSRAWAMPLLSSLGRSTDHT